MSEHKKLYLIGNAHIDPVWLWTWQDGVSEVLATFRSALDRMKDFEDFKFTAACASYYRWVEKLDPAMFEEIKERVKEGRWNIVGGWFLQPDCNIPSGESFARHTLISQRYFKEKFGVTAKTGYNVDSFGHNASLPKILNAGGMDNYVFMRPMEFEKPELKEHLFNWESPDGSKVCTFRIFHEYCIRNTDFLLSIQERADADDKDYMAFYGVGNHGGGPTIELINRINNLEGINGVYSTVDEYFGDTDKDELVTVRDELQHHARGCYSAETAVKTMNRKCEQNLITAEKVCVLANHLVGMKYPHEELNRAWENVLFNQFHDIMGGCALKKGYDDALYAYGETMNITEHIINDALQFIARSVDTLKGETLPSFKYHHANVWEHEVLGTPIFVFNPHTWTVKQTIAVRAGCATRVTDSEGNEIPFQMEHNDTLTYGTKRNILTFDAEVPPMGYAVYRVFMEKPSDKTFEPAVKIDGLTMENDKVRVEFDCVTGDICKFYVKKTGKYIIDKPCGAILLDETAADTWAHNVVFLGDKVAEFQNARFDVYEEGPVRCILRVTTTCANSVLRRDYILAADSDRVDVKVKVDFREKHRTLKFAFPISGKVTAEIPYGTFSREIASGEEPCGMWIASDDVCVANDSKYGYDTIDGEMRLTVMRGAIYADHGQQRGEFEEYMDQGIHEFTYSVYPFVSKADATRRACELNAPLRHIDDSFHDGKLPEKYAAFEGGSDNVIITAVKKAEDGDTDVVRFYEIEGKNTYVAMKLFGKSLKTSLGHDAVKTVTADGKELDFMEWEK